MRGATDAIISIHPSFADAILAGTKTIELRRRVPALAPGTRLWIYATRPTGAVVGFVTIKDVARAHPAAIWRTHGAGAGIDRSFFKSYFNGADVGVAILLISARRAGPISIDQLRAIRDRFHPPQVLVRLTAAETTALRKLAGV